MVIIFEFIILINVSNINKCNNTLTFLSIHNNEGIKKTIFLCLLENFKFERILLLHFGAYPVGIYVPALKSLL